MTRGRPSASPTSFRHRPDIYRQRHELVATRRRRNVTPSRYASCHAAYRCVHHSPVYTVTSSCCLPVSERVSPCLACLDVVSQRLPLTSCCPTPAYCRIVCRVGSHVFPTNTRRWSRPSQLAPSPAASAHVAVRPSWRDGGQWRRTPPRHRRAVVAAVVAAAQTSRPRHYFIMLVHAVKRCHRHWHYPFKTMRREGALTAPGRLWRAAAGDPDATGGLLVDTLCSGINYGFSWVWENRPAPTGYLCTRPGYERR